MGCCGQRRDSLKSSPPSRTSVRSVPAGWSPPRVHATPSTAPLRNALVRGGPGAINGVPINGNSRHDIALRYTETSRIVVQGSVTRRDYEFSGADPMKMVDSRDAVALLSARCFVRG